MKFCGFCCFHNKVRERKKSIFAVINDKHDRGEEYVVEKVIVYADLFIEIHSLFQVSLSHKTLNIHKYIIYIYIYVNNINIITSS